MLPVLLVTVTSPLELIPIPAPVANVVAPDIVPVLLTIKVPLDIEMPLAIPAAPLAETVPPLLLLSVVVPVPMTRPFEPPVTNVPVARLMVLPLPRKNPLVVPVTVALV